MSSSSEDNEMSCVVCLELAYNAHFCSKAECSKLVCGKCIKKKAVQAKCPSCRTQDSLQPCLVMNKQIDCQKIRCPEQCGKRVRRRSIETHVKYQCTGKVSQQQSNMNKDDPIEEKKFQPADERIPESLKEQIINQYIEKLKADKQMDRNYGQSEQKDSDPAFKEPLTANQKKKLRQKQRKANAECQVYEPKPIVINKQILKVSSEITVKSNTKFSDFIEEFYYLLDISSVNQVIQPPECRFEKNIWLKMVYQSFARLRGRINIIPPKSFSQGEFEDGKQKPFTEGEYYCYKKLVAKIVQNLNLVEQTLIEAGARFNLDNNEECNISKEQLDSFKQEIKASESELSGSNTKKRLREMCIKIKTKYDARSFQGLESMLEKLAKLKSTKAPWGQILLDIYREKKDQLKFPESPYQWTAYPLEFKTWFEMDFGMGDFGYYQGYCHAVTGRPFGRGIQIECDNIRFQCYHDLEGQVKVPIIVLTANDKVSNKLYTPKYQGYGYALEHMPKPEVLQRYHASFDPKDFNYC